MDQEEVVKIAPKISSGRAIIKSAYLVSLMTLLSRILGFVRDVVLAMIFGAGPAFDAFVVAFKIPNFMRRLFAEGAFSQAFVPVLSEYRANRTHAEVREFLNHVAGSLGLVLTLVVIVAEMAAPLIVTVFAPGFAHGSVRYIDATHMLHIMFPYLWLIALTAFAGATLNTFNRFGVPAFAPVLLNVVLILVACWWAPRTSVPIYTLAWGVMIGGLIQFAFQLPFLKKIRLLPIPKFSFNDSGVFRVLKLMVPALFGVSVAQLSLLIDNFFASFLQAGSISWLYYSDRLIYLPQGVIGVALATVVLPSLSRYHASENSRAYSGTLDWALRTAAVVGVPAALGLLVLSGPILTTLINHGAFNEFDVLMTRKSLSAFALGLPAFMFIKILASGFYSRQNIKTPVKIAAIAMLANLVFNVALVFPLKHAGLALSTSLASILNASLLLILLLRKKLYVPHSGWMIFWVRIAVASAVMLGVTYWLAGDLSHWFVLGVWQRIWHLAFIILAGMLAYLISLLISGFRKHHLRPNHLD